MITNNYVTLTKKQMFGIKEIIIQITDWERISFLTKICYLCYNLSLAKKKNFLT